MKNILLRPLLLIILTSSIAKCFAQVKKVSAIGITVKDMNTSVNFYHEVLGFKKPVMKNSVVQLMNN
jgi:catechol-2,3-dioxygenase